MSKLRIIKDKIVYDGKYIQLIERHFRNTLIEEDGVWEMVRRKIHSRIVAIIAITDSNEVILANSYRLPCESWVVEACAGIADREGESEEDLARRELLEETGYKVDSVKELIAGPFSAGSFADEIVFYAGYGAKKVQEPQLEVGEDIEVIKIPLRDLHQFLLNPPKNTKVDVKLFGVLYLLEKGCKK